MGNLVESVRRMGALWAMVPAARHALLKPRGLQTQPVRPAMPGTRNLVESVRRMGALRAVVPAARHALRVDPCGLQTQPARPAMPGTRNLVEPVSQMPRR